LRERFESTHLRHGEIQEHKVWPMACGQFDSHLAVDGLGDDAEVAAEFEHSLRGRPIGGFVVGEQHGELLASSPRAGRRMHEWLEPTAELIGWHWTTPEITLCELATEQTELPELLGGFYAPSMAASGTTLGESSLNSIVPVSTSPRRQLSDEQPERRCRLNALPRGA